MDSTGTLATYSYDPLSRRTALAYGNGAGVSYSYSNAGGLLTLTHNLSGTANDVTFTDSYTNAHQLAQETSSNVAYFWQPPSGGTQGYTPNALNQYASVGVAAYGYDLNGNLTSDGVTIYAYDAENRMLSASKTGVAASYAYDPLGRRNHKSGTGLTETYFVDSGTDKIAEYNASGALTNRYIPGPAIDEPIGEVTASGTHRYVHANRQGSIVAMSGAALTEGPYSY